MNKSKLILISILVLAAILRFYKYDFADVISDEVFYAYRSIGLVDTLDSRNQPTPFEWSEPSALGGWAKLSFHDHPPLIFWIQHWSFKIFGVNLFGMRLPFILAGIFSVWLTYLIAKRLLQSEQAALSAAAILAVNTYHSWVSRTGLLESVVIALMLLAIWLFLRAIEKQSGFYFAVVATGLAILAKYTAVILLPVFVIYLVWKHRDLLTARRVIFSILLLLFVLSPVIIYNFKLYQTHGHFDYQVSYLLKQDVPEWQTRPGREVGGFAEKFSNLFSNFARGYGPVFSLAAAIGALFLFVKKPSESSELLALLLGFLLLLFFVIGPEARYLPMLAPILAILAVQAALTIIQSRKVFLCFLAVLLALETAYNFNSYFTLKPAGKEVWTYSRLRRDSNAWGYNQLEQYLNELMAGFYPKQSLPAQFAFARNLQEQARVRAQAEGSEPKAILFIADSSMYGTAKLWYLTRRALYDDWPVVTDAAFLEAARLNQNFYREQGFAEFYYLKTADTLLAGNRETSAAQIFEQQLIQDGRQPVYLQRPVGRSAFKIYKF